MFVRPEAEVVLFAEELFIEMSGETVTTSETEHLLNFPIFNPGWIFRRLACVSRHSF